MHKEPTMRQPHTCMTASIRRCSCSKCCCSSAASASAAAPLLATCTQEDAAGGGSGLFCWERQGLETIKTLFPAFCCLPGCYCLPSRRRVDVPPHLCIPAGHVIQQRIPLELGHHRQQRVARLQHLLRKHLHQLARHLPLQRRRQGEGALRGRGSGGRRAAAEPQPAPKLGAGI